MEPAPVYPRKLLAEGAKTLGVSLPNPQLEQLDRYVAELKRWNQRINLTGLRSDRDIIIKLFLDSLALLPFLGKAASLADLGSGAGFPGLVLKIARPELALTLVESRSKKAAFLDYLVSLLKLDKVEVAKVYLTPGLVREWGPRFDAVVSRAALSLSDLIELAAPLLAPGGVLLAPKGPHLGDAELQAACQAAASQSLSPPALREYQVPFLDEPRLLVMAFKKLGSRTG
jgi:16S rRNA (guanine527-N7)-methyltransferase